MEARRGYPAQGRAAGRAREHRCIVKSTLMIVFGPNAGGGLLPPRHFVGGALVRAREHFGDSLFLTQHVASAPATPFAALNREATKPHRKA